MASVADLIAALESIEDKNAEVWVEGCDCWQLASGPVQVIAESGVLIESHD